MYTTIYLVLIPEIQKSQLKCLESGFSAYQIVQNNFVKDV